MDEHLIMRNIGIDKPSELVHKVDIIPGQLEYETIDIMDRSVQLRTDHDYIFVDQIMMLHYQWERVDVYQIIIMLQIEILRILHFLISAEVLSDMGSTWLNLMIIIVIMIMIIEMRITMQVEVSSEMMMIVLSEMFLGYLQALCKNSI